ncbi:lytic transglycosylase domain-containing protein [Gluconacetobacter asukensis]|uniref:Lytic transglycosylase domain-containing protein n=1 Tax=Gluconacetobacter asukensis TaxID=1017181 RepID=A0A7W4J1H5_9PROT|nr:lytic transglycosylase domain-containing protein [Gluconacetobacter asukensis]MBB2172879.1 lytic transglycosylase domain-containing protein [Gluconacetobacter asukensis]
MADDLQSSVDRAFREASARHNVDEKWLRAIAQTESGGRLDAVSPAGAVGLMQIMPDTARGLGIDPRDPVQAIHGAARMLDENLRRYGNPDDAMRAYNAGTDRARWDNEQTRAYPAKVMANMAEIAKRQSARKQPDVLDDSVYGWDDAPKGGGAATLDDGIYGWDEKPSPAMARSQQTGSAPEQSRLGKAWTVANDTVNAAGREIDRTGAGVSHLLGWLASAGHHLDNPVSRTANRLGDWVEGLEKADEESRAGDYGADYSNALGTAAGALLSTEIGGKLVRRVAPALEGSRPGRIVANTLTGDGSTAARWANNGLAAGVQTALAGGDWKDAAALGIGLGAAGSVAGRAGAHLSGAARRVGDYLGPEGARMRSAEGTPSAAGAAEGEARPGAASASEQRAEERAQKKAASNIGAFTSPDKAADAIMRAFSSTDGTRLYEALVPGVFHTLATRNRDVKMAGLEDNLRDLYPDAFRALDASNGDAYVRHLRETVGTPEQIQKMEVERSEFERAQRESAFANEEPVSTDDLHSILDRHIADSRGNEPVKAALNKAKAALTDASEEDGTAMPSNLWNVRKAIGYGLQQAAASESAHMRAAASRLSPFMEDLAEKIDHGAPGFRDYLSGYSSRSSDIGSLRFLQSRGLTQAANDAPSGEAVNYTALKRLIGQIDKNEVSVSTKGTDAVTPAQEARLRALYRDMLAEREMREAGRSSGASKTFKAAMTQRAKEVRGGFTGGLLAPVAAAIGGHEGGAFTGGALGAALHGGNTLVSHALANRRMTNMERTDQKVITRLLGG